MLAAAAVVSLLVASHSAAQDAPHQSVWDGVYTDAQATRGERDYGRACERCHGVDLSGDAFREIPALQSGLFVDQWSERSLKDLFDRIKRSMPADEPDSLTTRAYVDIVAYLLSANQFPSGNAELSRAPEDLQHILIDRARK